MASRELTDRDMERRLKVLMREAPGRLASAEVADLRRVYAVLEIPISDSSSLREISHVLYDRIRAALVEAQSSPRIGATNVYKLRQQMLLRHLVDGASTTDAARVLAVIRDATGDERLRSLENEAEWRTAISAAADVRSLRAADGLDRHSVDERCYALAEALAVLRSRGVPFLLSLGSPVLPRRSQEQVASIVLDVVARLGPAEFVRRTLMKCADRYDGQQRRLHLGHRPDALGRRVKATLPVGYLLALAFAAPPRAGGQVPLAEETIEAGFKLATALITSLDLRSLYPVEAHFQTHETIVRFLARIVRHDGAYRLIQRRPTDVSRTVRALFAWLPIGTLLGSGWTIDAFVAVIDAVFEQAGRVGPHAIDPERIVRRLAPGVPAEQVERVLFDCTHQGEPVNGTFRTLGDPVAFPDRPLARIRDAIVIADPAWCAPAFFEVVERAVHGHVGFNQKIGTALEAFVRAELRAHGVAVHTGTFTHDSKDYECDAIIETSTVVILLEVKKRELVAQTRQGDATSLLIDLSDSLFKAQRQLALREIALRRAGTVQLQTDAGVVPIALGARSVERIALTHLDYGSLQDRQVMSQALHILSTATITAAGDPGGRIAELQKRAIEIGQLLGELDRIGAAPTPNPFFNCWFLSLGHLQIVLDQVTCSEDLWRELRSVRSITFGTHDFYFEYAARRALGRKAASAQ